MRPVSEMTDFQVREAAHAAIIRELGVAGLMRYLAEGSLGAGDYTRDRREILPEHADARSLLEAAEAETSRLANSGGLPGLPS